MMDFIKQMHLKRIIRDLKATPREKKIDNIDEVKTIGVICRLSDEQNWNILHHFAKVMENQGKHVHIIALLNKDQQLDFVITHQATQIVRTKTEFSSFFNYLACSYDLLIDTLGEENFFSQYIALRTSASLKVVYATPAEDPSEIFDLIIRGDGQVELKGFFNNVIEYLSMIKK